jgi:hypothetical protein
MFEMYVTCPTTGQPTYAGVLSDSMDRKKAREFFDNSICPACGMKHVMQASTTWLEIPLASAPLVPEAIAVNIRENDPLDPAAALPRAAA